MFVEGILPDFNKMKCNYILELIEIAEFLLTDDNFIMSFIKYVALRFIVKYLDELDYKMLNKINKSLFNDYLDIQALLIIKENTSGDSYNIKQIYYAFNNLIIDSEKELEYIN